jgi:integrase
MPKTPKFAFKKTTRGWLLNVPASISASGVRERRYFTTRDLVKAEAQRLSEKYKKHGENASVIPPGVADDAVKALAILTDFHGVSLSEAARFYKSHHDLRGKAPTLREAWGKAIELRQNHRPTTQRDYRAWMRALPAEFLDMNVADITPDQIRNTLDSITTGETRWTNGLRYISTVFQQCVKDATLTENPCRRVQRPRPPERDDEVTVYSIDQLKALFAACRDYPGGLDRACSTCAVPFAILAFAGLRPNELERLEWEDIDPDLSVIRLGSSKTKKARRRNVRINATLQAWLETVPVEVRNGKVVPHRWRDRSARVRKEAGIDGLEMVDALRHSFGTYLLATEKNIEDLRSDMGHEHIRVFFNHYHKALTPEEALPYWQILPTGAIPPPTKAATAAGAVKAADKQAKPGGRNQV